MLTMPKWQTDCVKCQYSSRYISKKIMFSKPEDKIFDDLSKCCSSTSKDLALEALDCWRIWMENQHVEDWKINRTCYLAVQPLFTKKFHPLQRDGEVYKMKLSLLWLAVHKTQCLMHLEGPQHILEVFIQSCLSWLSCSEDLDFNITDLILRLLKFLFVRDVEDKQENEKFPPLSNDIWKSNKLFCRLVTLFLEIFHNWTKIKEKTDLLSIWNHVLDHCERAFALIPVPVWHRIFKLVDSICADNNELMKNRIFLLHQYATSLHSVLSNSKFIDCSQVLTTPAEALLQVAIELCVNNKEENIPFEIFQCCSEMCQVLSTCIIHTFGYESCIYKLSKIEEIESKPLLWGFWCGLANCFRSQVNDEHRENYSKMELKLYRKLRSYAANFDLDRAVLEEQCVFLIQSQLDFLRIPTTCENCSARNERRVEKKMIMEVKSVNSNVLSSIHAVNEGNDDFEGIFGFDVNNVHIKSCTCSEKDTVADLFMEIDIPENDPPVPENQCEGGGVCETCRMERRKGALDYKFTWTMFNFMIKNLVLYGNYQLLCENIWIKRLITFDKENRKGILFAPMCLTLLLEGLCNIAGKPYDSSTENFVEKVKKVQNKMREGTIFAPIKLFVSFKGRKGVEFYSNVVRYWCDLSEIVNDVDLTKNLNILKEKNEKSAVWLSMFLFLVNFTKNVFFESRENSISEFTKLDLEEEAVLTVGLVSFMRKVSNYKTRLSNFTFLENMNKILPKKRDNPVVIWTNFVSARNSKVNESILGGGSGPESCCKMSNDNLINIFNYFDELQSKISNETNLPVSNPVRIIEKKVSSENESASILSRLRIRKRSLVMPQTVAKVMENKSVTVVQAPPNVFRTMTFSGWRATTDFEGQEVVSLKENPNDEPINETPKKRRNARMKQSEKTDESPRTRTSRSSGKKPHVVISDSADEAVQDENVNIEITGKKCRKSETPPKRGSVNGMFTSGRMYSLRKRPLSRPSKFKDEKYVFSDDLARRMCLNQKCENGAEYFALSPCKYTAGEVPSSEKSQESSESDGLPVTKHLLQSINVDCDFETNEKIGSAFKEDTGDCSHTGIGKTDDVLIDVKVEVVGAKAESMHLNVSDCYAEISDLIGGLIEKAEEYEIAQVDCKIGLKKFENEDFPVKIESAEKDEIYDFPVCDSVAIKTKADRGVKRRLKCAEESTGIKKSKTEVDDNSEAKADRDVPSEEESATIASKLAQKPVIESRGSRMVALVSESPKLNGVYDSSPSSKYQTMKPPNVLKNSRASKMLALLPELQEVASGSDALSVKETFSQKTISENDNTRKGGISRGCTVGIMHHLTPSRSQSGMNAETPKRSPLRQRRSIRFDDDRNETVTYFTDSPPCQTIKQGMRFRGYDK